MALITVMTVMMLTPASPAQPVTELSHAGADCTRFFQDRYLSLLQPDASSRRLARDLLSHSLQQVNVADCELPERPEQLLDWMHDDTARTAAAFEDYLAERQQGAPRRYFPTRSHALLFLQRVAPTKRVDGAWLQGLCALWRDDRQRDLIRTYLDELGNGQPGQNHVVLFERLLHHYGINTSQPLPDALYQQGAIQLALGQFGDEFLPEIIGFNLGYEQLPLHLMITAHELAEVGIDPYYFSLHITVDNGDSGHARQAVNSVLANLPRLGDRDAFYQRVKAGFLLNNLGLGTVDIIRQIDLEQDVRTMLQHKAQAGRLAHSDRCRIKGRSLNQWLATEADTDGLLEFMTGSIWIQRHQDPQQSRFWQVIAGDQALMQGVFTPAETQLIYDWIAGDWLNSADAPVYKPYHRRQGRTMPATEAAGELCWTDPDCLWLQQQLHDCDNQAETADLLAGHIHAGFHALPAGLWATRQFHDLLKTL